jgi:hypothetical protein
MGNVQRVNNCTKQDGWNRTWVCENRNRSISLLTKLDNDDASRAGYFKTLS